LAARAEKMVGIACVLAEDRSKHTQHTAQKGYSFSHHVTYVDRDYDTERKSQEERNVVPVRTYSRTLTTTLDGIEWINSRSVRYISGHKSPIPV
jgi:hypothetical protein